MRIERLDHLVINVRDVEASAAWYTRSLGLQRVDFAPAQRPDAKRTAMAFGNQKLNLRPFDTDPAAWTTASNTSPGGSACAVARDLDQVTIGVAAVDRGHRAEGALPRHGPLGDLDAVRPQVFDDRLRRVGGDEAEVLAAGARVRRRRPCSGIGVERAEVEFLVAEGHRGALRVRT